MSGLFNSLNVAASGMNLFQTWIDTTANNVANINTVNPAGQPAYAEKFVQAQAVSDGSATGNGVAIAGIKEGSNAGIPAYDPSNPLADPQTGIVLHPAESLSDQMTNLMIAQRAYQANVTAFSRARDAYSEALQIGEN
jgi:flagellar basal-body rod protein FlgC